MFKPENHARLILAFIPVYAISYSLNWYKDWFLYILIALIVSFVFRIIFTVIMHRGSLLDKALEYRLSKSGIADNPNQVDKTKSK